MSDRPIFWSDQLAYGTRQKFSDKEKYVCASGISPSGIVHAGNFREIITSDFVVKSLKEQGEEVKFIYSWDEYDRFRKVPANVPDEFEKYIGKPLTEVPDPEGCHDSYARHFEAQLEKELEDMHMNIEFIRQTEKFKNGEYAERIKKGLEKREKVKEILDKYRKEPLESPYYPVRVYCTECGKDFTDVTDWNGEYTITYFCNECEEEREHDIREGRVKQPWRIDWPMRWDYEDVHFEPAGKEHSAAGGSRDTGNELAEEIYDKEPPVHQMYEFVTKDGAKISSSSGEDVFTISELKKVYSPEMIRFLFSETKPNKAFEIPFESEEIIQIYDRFDRFEENYFGEGLENDKKREHQERVYEIAMVEIPEEKPVRVPFKHAAFIAQTVPEEEWSSKGITSLRRTGHIPDDLTDSDSERILERLERAKNWAREYAPEEYVYQINWDGEDSGFSDEEVEALQYLRDLLDEHDFEDSDELDDNIWDVRDECALDTGDFFETCYQALLQRDSGPRLSTLIMSVGRQETEEILEKIV